MTEETAVAVQQQTSMTLKQVADRVNLVHQVLDKVLKQGTHYGMVPGCGKKMVLFKPGADVLAMTFRLVPQFQVTKTDLGNGHREYDVTCSMYGPDGELLGQGVGSGSTMEKKYRYRKDDNNNRIENEDIADVHNTVLKMAKKRAHVDATLTVTGAADIFTQDLIDDEDSTPEKPPVDMPVAKTKLKQKAEPSGEETAQGILEKVSTKTGESKKGPWTKYGLLIDGEWYSTFSGTLGAEAEGLQGETVTVEWEQDGKFKTAKTIAIMGDRPAATEKDLLDDLPYDDPKPNTDLDEKIPF